MIEFISDMLASPLIQRAFIVAVLVGLAAPVVGTYLVQRGLALLGDGIGHIALTGIALGWLAGAAANVSPHDAWAVPGAIIISVLGAVAIEVIRANGRTRGDVALAMLFYGGIAGGALFLRTSLRRRITRRQEVVVAAHADNIIQPRHRRQQVTEFFTFARLSVLGAGRNERCVGGECRHSRLPGERGGRA